jgi:hypothetical protein
VTGATRRVESGTPGGGVRAADHSRRFLDVIVTERRWIQAREDQERGRCLRSEIAIKRQATRVFTITCLSSELSIQLRANVPCLCARNLLPSAEDSGRENSDKAKKPHRSAYLWFLVLVLYGCLPHPSPPSINQTAFHHNFASITSRRVRNHVQGWSAFDLLRIQHQPSRGNTHQVGSARHRRRHFLKRVVELMARTGLHLYIFVSLLSRTTQLWFVALRTDSLIDDARYYHSSLTFRRLKTQWPRPCVFDTQSLSREGFTVTKRASDLCTWSRPHAKNFHSKTHAM